MGSELPIFYPLLDKEVYLPDCYDIDIMAVVCLGLNDSRPQLIFSEADNSTSVLFSNTDTSSRALWSGPVPLGTFSCSSSDGLSLSAITATGGLIFHINNNICYPFTSTGETFVSSYETHDVAVRLGDYWNTVLTIATCADLNPQEILFTNSLSDTLNGYILTNVYQTVSVRAGPLYLEDMSDVDILVPTTLAYMIYPSLYNISIDGMLI